MSDLSGKVKCQFIAIVSFGLTYVLSRSTMSTVFKI